MIFRNLATLMPLEDDTSDTITGFSHFQVKNNVKS